MYDIELTLVMFGEFFKIIFPFLNWYYLQKHKIPAISPCYGKLNVILLEKSAAFFEPLLLAEWPLSRPENAKCRNVVKFWEFCKFDDNLHD